MASGSLRFFFYGTLLASADNPVARDIHRRLGPGRPGTARGTLHAIADPGGWYPALVPGDGEVTGMVHAAGAGFGAADLAVLDAYEGGEYRRVEIAVRCGGERLAAQAYLYDAPLPPGARALPDGDFAGFLSREGRRGYGSPQ